MSSFSMWKRYGMSKSREHSEISVYQILWME